MKTELFLLRHGETEWNKEGRFQGRTDIPLSEDGFLQAVYLRDRLANQFDVIYTSPLNRALSTARIVCEGSSMEPIIFEEIIEIDFGTWEGLSLKQMEEQYPEEFYQFRMDEENGKILGSTESIKDASIRGKNALLKLVNQHPGKRILVLSHGGILKASLVGLMGWNMTMYKKIIFGNTSVSKLVFDEGGNPVIITLNDTSHLPTNLHM